jgi:hypothetical protein
LQGFPASSEEHGHSPQSGNASPLESQGLGRRAGQTYDRSVGEGEEIRQLRSLLARYDTQEVAAVEARVRHACVTARPEDAEQRALTITLDVLRLNGRAHVRPRHELVSLARLAPHDR